MIAKWMNWMKQKVKFSFSWFQLQHSAIISLAVWPRHMTSVVASITEKSARLIFCCVLGCSQSTRNTIRNMSSISHFDTLRWELPSNMLSLQGPNFLCYALLLIYNIYTGEETHYQRKGTRSSNFFSFPQHSQPKQKKFKLCKILKLTIPWKYFAHTHS